MNSRKEKVRYFFDNLSADYRSYRRRHGYFWNDSIDYYNYFLNGSESILQIGCGAGDTLNRLNGRHKVGIDFSEGMIKLAQESYPTLTFHHMDVDALVLDETYDVIVISNTIGFFDNVLDALHQIKQCCHPRTKVYIGYYSRLWQPLIKLGEIIGYKRKAPEQNWLSKVDIQNLLYLAGYEVYRANMRMLVPVNIPLVSWFFNKYIARLPLINSLCLNQYVFARQMGVQAGEDYHVSVVIPARNESGNIEDAIKRVPEMGLSTELIFIEGNSTDDTWEVIQSMTERYKSLRYMKIGQQDGKGKYNAVKLGFEMSEGDILMILDADLTVPPEDLPKFYDAIRSGKGEFINGSRLVYPMENKAMRFLNMLGNKFFSYAFSWLLEQPIKDTLCGTKVIFKKDYERLKTNRKYFGDFDPFGDFDLLFGAYKLNLKIIDLPIRYRERTYGDTNISRFRHGLILLRMVAFAMNRIKFI